MKKQFVLVTFIVFGCCGLLIAQDVNSKQTEKQPTHLQLTQAQLVKLQMEFIELQKRFLTCQQGTLASAAKTLEDGILKTVEAKPGQKFDWNTFTVISDPAVTAPAKP